MNQSVESNDKTIASRRQRAITVRLDQPTRDRINRKIPSDYRTLSALVRAGIDEILARQGSIDRRIDRRIDR
jgi:Arc/MetJ-type ribon-helix-helix transcriptional regulator